MSESNNKITYELIKCCGTLSNKAKGWNKELNIISWNNNIPKYDLREWNNDHTRMGKGITMSDDEIISLYEIIKYEVERINEEYDEENNEYNDGSMKNISCKDDIIKEYADELFEKIMSEIIDEYIKREDVALNIDYLNNIWEEICYQKQYEITIIWNVYIDDIKGEICVKLSKLNDNEKKAIYAAYDGEILDNKYVNIDENEFIVGMICARILYKAMNYRIPGLNFDYDSDCDDIKEKMKCEALKYMKKLNISMNVIKSFKDDNVLFLSEDDGILCWLEEEEKEMVKKIENKRDFLVYHVIKSNTNFGRIYNMLIITPDEEEWEEKFEMLDDGIVSVYAVNIDNPEYSEYGDIGVVSINGGLKED